MDNISINTMKVADIMRKKLETIEELSSTREAAQDEGQECQLFGSS